MDRLEAMSILLTAADTGSLSAASRQLRIPLATVSRRVSELEEHLKVRLFRRGHRRLALTEAGRGYVSACRGIIEDIADAERTAAGEYHTPQGELTISAPVVVGRTHVLPVVTEFLRLYPDIRMHVQLGDRFVNMVEEHVDLAMHVGELPDSDVIASRVGLIRQVVCASPAYLEMRGAPEKPADLASHDCVSYATQRAWTFRVDGAAQTIVVPSRLVVNSAEAAVTAAIAGAGIAQTLQYHADDLVKARSLVTLLEEYEPSPSPVNVLYPGQGKVPMKVRAFLDFSIPRLRERLGYQNR